MPERATTRATALPDRKGAAAATSIQESQKLSGILSILAEAAIIPRAVRPLEATQMAAGTSLRKSVLDEVPAFSRSGNPEVLPGLDKHFTDHIDEILRLFGGGGIGDFEFVRAHARLRAEQHFPLDAILHAYRCGHRELSHWLRDAAIATAPVRIEAAVSAVADFAIEYTDTVSTIVTADYVAHTRRLAEVESDRRTELLGILLSGFDESDGRVTGLLKRAGYLEQRQTYCVVAAQSINAAEMEQPGRAVRLAEAIVDAVAAAPIRVLTGTRNGLVVAVLSDLRRQSGWTAPQTALAERLRTLLLSLGPTVIVGTSTDQPSTAFLPRGLAEATIALEFADVARRVVQFSDLPLRGLMLSRGSDFIRSVAPSWLAALAAADERSKGSLVMTLRALADADLNVQLAGRSLGVHPNTVYARLIRIRDLTGLDGQRYHDLGELLLAADCSRG